MVSRGELSTAWLGGEGQQQDLLESWRSGVRTTISTPSLPESGTMKGPKIGYGMYLLEWAGSEGE